MTDYYVFPELKRCLKFPFDQQSIEAVEAWYAKQDEISFLTSPEELQIHGNKYIQ